jgi:hypothetical protein
MSQHLFVDDVKRVMRFDILHKTKTQFEFIHSSSLAGLGLDIRNTRQLESPLTKLWLMPRSVANNMVRLAIPLRLIRSDMTSIRPVCGADSALESILLTDKILLMNQV